MRQSLSPQRACPELAIALKKPKPCLPSVALAKGGACAQGAQSNGKSNGWVAGIHPIINYHSPITKRRGLYRLNRHRPRTNVRLWLYLVCTKPTLLCRLPERPHTSLAPSARLGCAATLLISYMQQGSRNIPLISREGTSNSSRWIRFVVPDK